MHNFSLRWIPPQRPVGACPYLRGGVPSLSTPKEPPCTWAGREVVLDLRSGLLPLYFSRAQLLPLALSLECLGEDKASISLHLTNTSCSSIYLLPQKHKLIFIFLKKLHIEYVVTSNNPLLNHSERTASKSSLI